MVKEYLNSRLDNLTDDKNAVIDKMTSIEMKIRESKKMLDSLHPDQYSPFAAFSPRKIVNKEKSHYEETSDDIKKLNEDLDTLKIKLKAIESEIQIVKNCLSEVK